MKNHLLKLKLFKMCVAKDKEELKGDVRHVTHSEPKPFLPVYTVTAKQDLGHNGSVV